MRPHRLTQSLGRPLLFAAVFLALLATPGFATLTDPVLSVSRAARIDGVALSLVEIEAAFPFEDLVQIPVALQVMLYSPGSGSYLRFDLVAGAFSGVAPGLGDGLDAQEAQTLLNEGLAEAAPRLVALESGRIVIQAPPQLIPAGARVQLFLAEDAEIAFSNAVVVEEAP